MVPLWELHTVSQSLLITAERLTSEERESQSLLDTQMEKIESPQEAIPALV